MHAYPEQVRIWTALRNYYSRNLNQILDYYPAIGHVPDDIEHVCGYKMTPIEWDVYCQIKFSGLPLLCLQFPVNKYFIDFADPIMKIGIEADGALFHQDRYKDEDRQKIIESEGWEIYRIKGKFAHWGCTKCVYGRVCEDSESDEYDEEELEYEHGTERLYTLEAYKRQCCRGIIQTIAQDHYGRSWREQWRLKKAYLGIAPRREGIFSLGEVLQQMISSGEWMSA